MILLKEELENLGSRYRATLINSLAGVKTAVLVGTKSNDSFSNLAIFNSLIHIGANPPLYGFICRPDTVKRDTLSNILENSFYTFNYLSSESYVKAHQTSAKFERTASEFKEVGFEEEYIHQFHAPFVQEAFVKIAMKLVDKIDIKINGTILLIGSIEFISLNENLISDDGFVALEQEDLLSTIGLDAYYQIKKIGRLSYAKPGENPKEI